MAEVDEKVNAMEADQPEYPIAVATPCDVTPVTDAEIANLVSSYEGQSVGEMYRGPGWVDADGTACVIVIARDRTIPRRVANAGQCGLIAWLWNNSPSTPFSLGLSLPGESIRSGLPRWMRSASDPIVQAIRTQQRFLVLVATVHGESSGWFDADFRRLPDGRTRADVEPLRHIFEFPVAGIPFSNVHARFEVSNRERFNDSGVDEIPLWEEPISDFWLLMYVQPSPWAKDLIPKDHAKAVWGREAWERRHKAAGRIQVIIERQRLDGVLPCFDAAGLSHPASALPESVGVIAESDQSISTWLAAIAGPLPDAQLAHEAAVALLHDPPALYTAVRELLWEDFGDDGLTHALHATFIAALLDARVTEHGTHRPSLSGDDSTRAFDLIKTPIDCDAPRDAIRAMWVRVTTDWIELFKTAAFLGPSDLPIDVPALIKSFDHVALQGGVEDAEVRLQVLLLEAQEARQWSIPWGARVQLQFGPFEMMRIFELDGDFRCTFLDRQRRYFQVGLNLATDPPKAESSVVPSDGASPHNREAEVIVELVAAAIVRDFLVVEERESVFQSRRVSHRAGGREIESVIYLPRVRYTASAAVGLPLDGELTARARHHVAAHLRRCENASAGQRLLALRYGLRLPHGFTFVRPFERGLAAHAQRIRTYRSRSASRLIFEGLETANGSRPAWFDFEKDCKRLMEQRGLDVLHQAANRDGDGGVDLFATDRAGDTYVVQCKCWSGGRVVRPATVRELAGAMKLADLGGERESQGILITTSTFTTGAVSAANQLGIELIDGSRFLSLRGGGSDD